MSDLANSPEQIARNARTRAELKASQAKFAAMGVGSSKQARAVRAARNAGKAELLALVSRLIEVGGAVGIEGIDEIIAQLKGKS